MISPISVHGNILSIETTDDGKFVSATFIVNDSVKCGNVVTTAMHAVCYVYNEGILPPGFIRTWLSVVDKSGKLLATC